MLTGRVYLTGCAVDRRWTLRNGRCSGRLAGVYTSGAGTGGQAWKTFQSIHPVSNGRRRAAGQVLYSDLRSLTRAIVLEGDSA